jgi:hypothetical protein
MYVCLNFRNTLYRRAVGTQAFSQATAFNANIASWNVLRVTTFSSAFDGVGLADCIKRGVYANWGSTLRLAYPTWTSLSVCITDSNIGAAVTAWATNPTTAATTYMYGNIAHWNTAAVTGMASLFYNLSNTVRSTFNADIGKWNVASVANMYRVRALLCRVFIYKYMYMHTLGGINTRAHTRARARARTHTHTYTHTHR